MNIKVYNNDLKVFEGTAKQFLIENECDGDIKDMLKETFISGCSEMLFFSGLWKIEKCR